MSTIISPLPPIECVIRIDRVTGVTSYRFSESISLEMVTQAFAAVKLQILTEATARTPITFNLGAPLPFEAIVQLLSTFELAQAQAQIVAKKAGGDWQKPFEKPDEKPTGNTVGNPGGQA